MDDGDQWPQIRARLLDDGILVVASPTWVGEAMHTVDYNDLDATPDEVASATAGAARNAVHLATLLKANPYPAE
jgi:hypothetical protein